MDICHGLLYSIIYLLGDFLKALPSLLITAIE